MSYRGIRISLVAGILLTAQWTFASVDTNGPDGISSTGLTGFNTNQPLTGSGIKIGQVEVARPAVPNFDSNASSSIKPTAVFVQTGPPTANATPPEDDEHAEEVAGIMISQDPLIPGVAQNALLYSSAFVDDSQAQAAEQVELVTMQQIASQPNMTAVNNSWGQSLSSIFI
ncbi:MAG TPA: S8 family serine peptidase [Pirellulales bacterium]|jgi:hypothetical protein|nr:S8 family serine peptidase [Pirellulales bacterium]